MPPPLSPAELPERVLLVTVTVSAEVEDATAVAVGRVAGEGAVGHGQLWRCRRSCRCRRRFRRPRCRRRCCWSRSPCCRRVLMATAVDRAELSESVLLVTVSVACRRRCRCRRQVTAAVAGEGAVGHVQRAGVKDAAAEVKAELPEKVLLTMSSVPLRVEDAAAAGSEPSCLRGCCWSRSACR